MAAHAAVQHDDGPESTIDVLVRRLKRAAAVPQLRLAAESGLEDLCELLEYRERRLQGEAADSSPGRCGSWAADDECRNNTKTFVARTIMRKSSSSMLVNGNGSNSTLSGGGAVAGSSSPLRESHKRDSAADHEAEAEAKAQRRRSSNAHQFLSTAAERAVASSSLLPGTAEGGQGAIAQFKEGFQRFKSEVISQHREFFRDLASAQSPQVMVIACCDSRVDPALLLGASPGDIFIVRNIANLVPPFERQGNYHGTSAALEYAVRNLKVQHIMILGHKNCGGVRALMGRADASKTTNDFIDNWMEIAAQACERTKIECAKLDFAAQCAYCERESVNVSLSNLLTFPFIKEAVARQAIELHGWYYDLEAASMDTWKLKYVVSEFDRLV